MAPRSGALHMLSSSPSRHDTDAASQQLLAEASSPVRRPTAAPTAAQRGASLLNAARALPKPPAQVPAPAGRAGKLPKPGQPKPTKVQKSGKLPRASLSSLVLESSQKKVRGKQMYDIDPSPQKKRRSLPAQIAALDDEEEDIVPETSQAQPDDDLPAEIPELPEIPESLDISGPKEALYGDDDIVDAPSSPIATREEVSSATKKRRGRPRKTGDSVVSRTSDASAAVVREVVQGDAAAKTSKSRGRPRKSGESTVSPQPGGDTAEADEVQGDVQEELQDLAERPVVTVNLKRKARPDLDIEPDGNGEPSATIRPKKVRKIKGPKMISPDGPEFEEDLVPPIAASSQDARREAKKRVRQEAREVRRQERQQGIRLRDDLQPQVNIPIRSTRPRAVPSDAVPSSATQRGVTSGSTAAVDRNGKTAQRIARSMRTAASDDVDNNAGAAANGKDDDRLDNSHDGDEVGDDQQRVEQDEAVAAADEQEGVRTDAEGTGIPALDTVFEFAATEERSGVCSMGLARKIHRNCDRAHVTLSGDSCSLDDITTCGHDLVRLLRSIRTHVQEDSRAEFKRDAFAYLFRALSLVLESMYDKMQDREGNAIDSYEAIQIMHPFVRGILKFKDTMDSWKVKVQQQAQGDRLIKGVESSLVAPLRIVEKELKTRLDTLQKAEQDRQARIEIQRQQERQEQEMIKKEEAQRSVRERRKRWQDLHIARMQCESDPYRRRRLRFVEPPDAAETDANGDHFERVPFFVERSAPPPSSVVPTSGKEWTQEQETVLLDALQSSSSLERIFRNHCRPGGALRDFSVSDFAAKLAWVRSAWAQLSHQHGWELPEWVKKIPVLP